MKPKTMDKSYFMRFFGEHPLVRILDFLMDNFAFDYTKTDIAKNSDVSWATLYQYWGRLEKNGIVVKTRSVGNSTLYRLNTGNPFVKKLLEMDMLLCSWNEKVKDGAAKAHGKTLLTQYLK